MKPGAGQQWQVLGVTASPSGASCYSHSLLFLPQLKAQMQEASPPDLPFLEDAKATEVGGFFRVDDDFVFPEDKPSAWLLEADGHPGPRAGRDLRSLNGDGEEEERELRWGRLL